MMFEVGWMMWFILNIASYRGLSWLPYLLLHHYIQKPAAMPSSPLSYGHSWDLRNKRLTSSPLQDFLLQWLRHLTIVDFLDIFLPLSRLGIVETSFTLLSLLLRFAPRPSLSKLKWCSVWRRLSWYSWFLFPWIPYRYSQFLCLVWWQAPVIII